MDALNRTAVSAYMDGTLTTNTWDQIGQQTSMQDTTGITSYLYDLNQRQVAVQNPTGINLTYSFDAVDNRVTMQDIGGTTSYLYDAQSRNTVIVNPLNERTSIQYDALDREYRRVLANGGAISHTFDAAGRETLIQNISAAGVAQAVFTNTYSATNNRLTVQELDGTRVTFGYDVTSQLTLEQRNGAQAYDIGYSYDRTGNRLTQTSSGAITNYNYNAANAQVLITPPTGAPTTQTFDPVGNLTIQNTGGALTTQTWSPENRLLSISNPDGSGEQSTYSADGLRKSRTSGGVTTNFTWDQQNLLLETDTSNVIQARYTDFPGYWGGLTSQNRNGVSSFYGYDSQGSVRILTNSAGTPTDSYVYTAFGVELLNGSGTVNPFRYVGLYGYYMTFINLYYVRARWLDAVKGRWDSRDPIGRLGGSWNTQEYVGNRPTFYVDPKGLQYPGDQPAPNPNIEWTECSARNKALIMNSLLFICKKLGSVSGECKSPLADCFSPPRVDHCFDDICNGTTKLKVECDDTWRGHLARWGWCRNACGYNYPPGSNTIVLCMRQIYMPDECDNITCVLAHEMIHSCGKIGHTSTAFGCISGVSSQCTTRTTMNQDQ